MLALVYRAFIGVHPVTAGAAGIQRHRIRGAPVARLAWRRLECGGQRLSEERSTRAWDSQKRGLDEAQKAIVRSPAGDLSAISRERLPQLDVTGQHQPHEPAGDLSKNQRRPDPLARDGQALAASIADPKHRPIGGGGEP